MRSEAAAALCALFLTPALSAQGPAFQTPGQPTFGYRGIEATQATRFSSEFNPAFSFVVDALGDYASTSGGDDDDGFDLELRTLELGGQAWIDPSAWAYFIVATEDEEVVLEEAAIDYVGFEGNSTLRAGRFFLDFGKQMQLHVHELRTLERPLVLRAFLGEEVKGDGLRWEHWIPVGDATVVRWSLGAFANLLPEENEVFDDSELGSDVRKDADELSYGARVTGFRDLSDDATVQVGLSARVLPAFSVEFEDTGDVEQDLANTVYGLDLTFGWVDDTGLERWTLGGELLVDAGDTGAENPVAGTVDVSDDTLTGSFAFVDYAWDPFHSAGLQVSAAELARDERFVELEGYFTYQLSEFQRLRLGVSVLDAQDEDDVLRFAVQYTAVLGAHGHGLSW